MYKFVEEPDFNVEKTINWEVERGWEFVSITSTFFNGRYPTYGILFYKKGK